MKSLRAISISFVILFAMLLIVRSQDQQSLHAQQRLQAQRLQEQQLIKAGKPSDASKADSKVPDISGLWQSASPIDCFAVDQSEQPVNTFDINAIGNNSFIAHYIGSLAPGITLAWNDELERFEGESELTCGYKEFVVKPTDDRNKLNCEIQRHIDLTEKDHVIHKDSWTRIGNKPVEVADGKLRTYLGIGLLNTELAQANQKSTDSENNPAETREQLERLVEELLDIKLREEQERLAELKRRIAELEKQIEFRKTNRISVIRRRVEELVKSVDLAEQEEVKPRRRRFEASERPFILKYEDQPELTEKMKLNTEVLLHPYMKHLQSIGFDLKPGQVTLRVQNDMNNAHYFHNNLSIVIDPRVVVDQSIIRREYNHHALSVVLGDQAATIFQSCSGVESALADYLGCSDADDPIVGREFVAALSGGNSNGPLRTMDNQRHFAHADENSGRHNVGEVLSGALWEMRKELGKDALDPLVVKAWIRLPKMDATKGQLIRFGTALLSVVPSEEPNVIKTIHNIFESRGFEVLPPKTAEQ